MQQQQLTRLLAAIVTRLANKAEQERLVAAEVAIAELARRVQDLEARPTLPAPIHLVETRARRTPRDPASN